MTAEAKLMPIPLWHGTSSWFLPGIMEHGLGTVDVHAQLRSREFYEAAWNLQLELATPAERARLEEEAGQQARATIADAVTPGGFNYRYRGIYCYGDGQRAERFARYGYGSELVRHGADLLKQVRAHSPDAADKLLADHPEMAACLAHAHQPFVIRLDRVARRHVRMEGGKPLVSIIDLVVDEYAIAKGYSFEVTAPVNRSNLTVFPVGNACNPQAWT